MKMCFNVSVCRVLDTSHPELGALYLVGVPVFKNTVGPGAHGVFAEMPEILPVADGELV